jgi:nitroreductase
MDLTTIDHLLTTTRSVRKRLDLMRPVAPEIVERCLEIAIQAPSGSDRQKWHFVVITNPALRAGLAELYRRAFADYRAMLPASGPSAPRPQLRDSSSYLAEHFHEVPALVLFCYEGRVEQAGPAAQASLYGSILPAAWSFMLALRARGLGSVWTTLHLRYEQEAARLLGLPSNVTQAALVPVAYYTGDDFKPAQRTPVRERTYWNGWKQQRDEVIISSEEGLAMAHTVAYLWWAECPSHEEGYALLREALSAEGLDAEIVSIEVTSEEQAQRLEFIGSPTFRVHGRDLDPQPVPTGAANPYALTCRAYRREDGRIGPLPTLAWLRQALRQALQQPQADATAGA